MTKDENIRNPASCWNKAAGDEPIFVLRATDSSAPDLITFWARRYEMQKGGYNRMTPEQRAKYHEALRVAEAMKNWFNDDDIPF